MQRASLLTMFLLFLLTPSTVYSQTVLIAEKTIKISYTSAKIDSGKKHDSWKIDISIETPAQGSYFVKGKSNDLLADLDPGRFIKISVANHVGAFSTGDKFISGEKANLAAANGSSIYEIPALSRNESFTINTPRGTKPDIHATLLAELVPLQSLPLIRASPEELFSGSSPQSRMFLIYNDIDTLLVQRDHILHFTDRNNKPAEATYTNEMFLVHYQDRDTMSSQLNYMDWQGKRASTRIKNEQFQLLSSGNSTVIAARATLQIKDGDARNRIVKLEPVKTNVVPFNVTVPVTALPLSDNRKYSLVIGAGGALELKNNLTGQSLWSNMAFAAAPKGFATTTLNGMITINLLNFRVNPNGVNEKGAFMAVGDDGNLIIYRSDGFAVWQSNTKGR